MRYRVRNADGELEFESAAQLEAAWRAGFVEPEDEVLEEGRSEWRKAKALPLLQQASAARRPRRVAPWLVYLAVGLTGGGFALWRLAQDDYVVGLIAAFVVAGLLVKVTTEVQQRRR